MADHLTPLVLDTVAAGLPFADSARVHLDGCEACRTKLEAVKQERAAAMMSARFAAGLKSAVPPEVRRTPVWIGLAVAASLLAIVGVRSLSGSTDTTLLKGGVSIELLKDGATPVSEARVGDKLALAVGGAGYQQVAVFGVSDKGESTILVPWAPLKAGARVPVGSTFEVTPGSLAVIACFDDHPTRTEAVLSLIKENVKPRAPLGVVPPLLPHGACAKTVLTVAP